MKGTQLILFWALFAAAASAAITKDAVGCYHIGSSDELFEFAAKVNAEDNPEKSACGILTSNIVVNQLAFENDALVSNPSSLKPWTPLVEFHGIFDGKGHSISGLYATSASTVGFIQSIANGNSVVRNVNIVGSYFKAEEMAGGLIGNIWNAKVIIDNSSFNGIVAADNGKNMAGIVANISYNSNVVISNSKNEGTIKTGKEGNNLGTCIGLVQGKTSSKTDAAAYVRVLNYTNSGKVIKDRTLVGTSSNTHNIGKNETEESDEKIVVSGTLSADDVSAYYDPALKDSILKTNFNADGFSGVMFTYEGGKLIATITDAVDQFVIPRNLSVDSVRMARTFKEGVASTLALPFSIAVDKVVGGTFVKLDSVSVEQNRANAVYGRNFITGNLSVYHPYLVIPSQENLVFNQSPINLVKTEDLGVASVFWHGLPDIPKEEYGDREWFFIATIEKKRWEIGKDNDDELGGVFGFAGSEIGDVKVGEFVKVSNRVAVRPLRAFLYCPKAAKNKDKYPALTKTAAMSIEVPDNLPVIIVDPKESGDVTGLRPPFKAPTKISNSDSWHDMKGRSLQGKPTSQGVFINNRTNIIIK